MKLIILDRDGVINQEFANQHVVNAELFVPIPGSIQAIVELKQAGYTVVAATNQSIIGKNLISLSSLEKIHDKLQNLLQMHGVQLDQIFICPHQSSDNCQCRKPRPGMLWDIATQYQIDFTTTQVYFVGDALSDLLAADAVGAIPVLVKTGKGKYTWQDKRRSSIKNLSIFEDLNEFTKWLLDPLVTL